MTKKSILIILPFTLFIIIFAVPLLVGAQGFTGQLVPCSGEFIDKVNTCNFCALIQLVRNVINFIVLSFIVPIAAIAFAIAGIIYVTAVGNPGKVKQAHDIFFYTFWGLILTLLAWLIVSALAFTFLSPTAFPNGVFGFGCPGGGGGGAGGSQEPVAPPPYLYPSPGGSQEPVTPPPAPNPTPPGGGSIQCSEPLSGNSCIINMDQIDACNNSNAACSVVIIGNDTHCRCGNSSPLIPPPPSDPGPLPQIPVFDQFECTEAPVDGCIIFDTQDITVCLEEGGSPTPGDRCDFPEIDIFVPSPPGTNTIPCTINLIDGCAVETTVDSTLCRDNNGGIELSGGNLTCTSPDPTQAPPPTISPPPSTVPVSGGDTTIPPGVLPEDKSILESLISGAVAFINDPQGNDRQSQHAEGISESTAEGFSTWNIDFELALLSSGGFIATVTSDNGYAEGYERLYILAILGNISCGDDTGLTYSFGFDPSPSEPKAVGICQ